MKLTQAYLRKLIMEELLNQQLQEAIDTKDLKALKQPQAPQQPQASSPQQDLQDLAKKIKDSAKTSPFITMVNQQTSAQDQLFVVQKFLELTQLKDPKLFYTGLYNMASKLKDINPETQTTGQEK